ncbi:MAG: metal ABC transporter ATPase [Okeania sp. SIO3H1]|uniref:HMA2 domain-containing protein n=1 Tax=Okeania sp. SIO1I7 TaxID=2607772 RepID=UPI0013C6B945|nr:metal ABC transporter ATPase [Okeania sp. SIO1I7]NEN90687.1 metal ABC transporter ATPase [Okeania sp. SIO3H1]NET28980.1 metal ABC transporter ATPase [Okeania sp. SIO1I7]
MATTSNYTNNTNTVETTGEQLGAFLQAHNEIEFILPPLVGLMITNRFQLRGATALLVNLTVAGFVRQIIEQLKEQKITVVTPVVETEATTISQSVTPVASDDSPAYTIVHSTPGRIRLRIPRVASEPDYTKRLEQLLNTDSHVLKVRINRAAASIVIQYQAEGMSDWELGMLLMSIIQKADSDEEKISEVEE